MKTNRQLIRKLDGSHFLGDEIHLRQGDMDGACGPYCLAMAMIALELTTKEEIITGRYHGNSKIAKLINSLEDFSGEYFFRNGANRKHLIESIKVAFNRNIDVHYHTQDVDGRDFRDFMNILVKKDVDFVCPVILGIDFGKNADWRHWVLAVGYEYNPNGPSSYLLLDPGAAKPRKGECWNAKLEEKGSGGPLPYKLTPNQGETYRIAMFDAIGLIPK